MKHPWGSDSACSLEQLTPGAYGSGTWKIEALAGPRMEEKYWWKGCFGTCQEIFLHSKYLLMIYLPHEVLPTSRECQDLSSVNGNSSKHEQ